MGTAMADFILHILMEIPYRNLFMQKVIAMQQAHKFILLRMEK